MSAPPIPMVWSDGEGVFRPLPNFLRVARQHYGAGEVVPLAPLEARSRVSHDHFFACVHQAWQSLPEHLTERFKDEDELRKDALIRTGHRHTATTVCMFKTEAKRLAATLMQQGGDYAIVVVDGRVVTRYTAKSQTYKAMGKEAFGRSKQDVLNFLADLIGVEPQALSQARAA